MQEQIDKVELVLENCEIITIDGRHIGELNIKNVEYSLSRLAVNYIGETYTANHFSMSMNRDVNVKDDIIFTIGEISDKQIVFDRLHEVHDITSINIYLRQDWFQEPTVKRFGVNWHYDEDDCDTNWINHNQKTYINQFGDLFIVVDENKGIDDVFGLEKIEDKEYMDFIWAMYGVDK